MEPKNYESRLEEAKKLYQTANKDQKYLLESLFPELAESKDERIRKYLITYFTNIDDCASNIKGRDVIAWLEKQEGKHITESQTRWRPSEEQMQMLHRAVVAIAPGVVHDGLESLYNNLKNL